MTICREYFRIVPESFPAETNKMRTPLQNYSLSKLHIVVSDLKRKLIIAPNTHGRMIERTVDSLDRRVSNAIIKLQYIILNRTIYYNEKTKNKD